MKEEINEKMIPNVSDETKIYGSSVLDYNADSVDDDFAFNEDIMDQETLEKERDSLKVDNPGTVKEVIETDAISGIKSSTEDTDKDRDFEKISEIIDSRDIRGKTISRAGKEMIKDLLKSDPTDDELKHISICFDNITNEDKKIDDISVEDAESILGERVVGKIKSITTDNDYESVIVRFTSQLYNTYQHVVQYNDDMRELSKLAKKVNDRKKKIEEETKKNDDGEQTIEDIDTEFKSLMDIQSDIMDFMEKVKNLDDRNSRLRQDYTIDDYDIRTCESVKKCLDCALSFEKVYAKINNASVPLKKEFKDIKYVNSTIENWIQSIKNDPYTLFTFPVNDFLSLKEIREQLVGFFYNTILIDNCVGEYGKLPDNVSDLEDYLLTEEKVTLKDIEIYKTQALLILFVLSKTFKYKKLDGSDERRILSYTLDIISKLGVKDHRERFIKLVNFAYNEILN